MKISQKRESSAPEPSITTDDGGERMQYDHGVVPSFVEDMWQYYRMSTFTKSDYLIKIKSQLQVMCTTRVKMYQKADRKFNKLLSN